MVSALALVSLGLSLVALSPILSAMSSKVCSPVTFPPLHYIVNFNLPHPGSVGLVSRFGQFYKSVDPGLVQVNVCTESLRIVDVKVQIISIGRQMVITRDNVNVEMYVRIYIF